MNRRQFLFGVISLGAGICLWMIGRFFYTSQNSKINPSVGMQRMLRILFPLLTGIPKNHDDEKFVTGMIFSMQRMRRTARQQLQGFLWLLSTTLGTWLLTGYTRSFDHLTTEDQMRAIARIWNHPVPALRIGMDSVRKICTAARMATPLSYYQVHITKPIMMADDNMSMEARKPLSMVTYAR